MTAIVLAGGRGSRMKADKASLAVGGRTLLEHVLVQVKPFFDEILVSVSAGQAPRLKSAVLVVEDETPGRGPLGGILAGLSAAKNDACAVIACDIPEIDVPLLRSLAWAAGKAEIAVPVGPSGHHEPLFAVYRKSVVPEIRALILSEDLSILRLFERCRTIPLGIEIRGWPRNLNTRADYEAYLRSLAARRP